ncbi:phosphate:acyl-[acyl carrier protein] acyltransferase [Fictibacillus enclensis]|uniref:Phosphate acyltransferase n=1 Tax=Fictibacillus enclensis TaxID=1017270 RepID=A0A0V8JD29_9BACL|nr:phosphate acyltransferase PlsX [Fictibacillus enclensis]KSU85039.1 phosphate acyltransferase [Fictibacillus enclensis]SCB89933.1 phosphate:acyl-[acyl carrier protein] acyltransferase [Fictibacillus enclensis]
MRIAIDAMGGDNAPVAQVKGALKALSAFEDLNIVLIGDENKISPYLTSSDRVEVMHTEEKIGSDEEPVRAVRKKKNASMVLAAKEVKEGRADACISAGNTGALMASGLFNVGRISGIDRPALSPTLPTMDGKGFLLLDVGANMDAKPEHLLQYAIMGSTYAEQVRGIKHPKVGLLNVGTEDEKGNALSKAAFSLLKDAPVHFIGNVEARDLLNGAADVVVCDGFSGNVVLKTIEGTALMMFSMLKQELTATTVSKLAAGLLKPRLKGLKSKLDYSEYGGAGLFGLAAPVVKAHGSSDENAIFNAVRQTRTMVEKKVVSIIAEKMKEVENEKKGEE